MAACTTMLKCSKVGPRKVLAPVRPMPSNQAFQAPGRVASCSRVWLLRSVGLFRGEALFSSSGLQTGAITSPISGYITALGQGSSP